MGQLACFDADSVLRRQRRIPTGHLGDNVVDQRSPAKCARFPIVNTT